MLLLLAQSLYLVLNHNWICFALSVGWILVYELKLGSRFGLGSIPLLLINIARCACVQLPELFRGNIQELKSWLSLICNYCLIVNVSQFVDTQLRCMFLRLESLTEFASCLSCSALFQMAAIFLSTRKVQIKLEKKHAGHKRPLPRRLHRGGKCLTKH